MPIIIFVEELELKLARNVKKRLSIAYKFLQHWKKNINVQNVFFKIHQLPEKHFH